MAKSATISDSERRLVEARLEPVIKELRHDARLRNEFLLFAQVRGGDITLFTERLRTVWWKSRKSMYPGFFVLLLTEFGVAKGLIDPSRDLAAVQRK